MKVLKLQGHLGFDFIRCCASLLLVVDWWTSEKEDQDICESRCYAWSARTGLCQTVAKIKLFGAATVLRLLLEEDMGHRL